jgi:hypothetical protein
MMLLKQSTAVDLPVGPFVDATDGVTPETALTITQPDVRLKKNGGAWAQKSAAQTLSHEENGWYEVSLSTTDTDTLGHLMLAIYESGALPVWREFMVVVASTYDNAVTNGLAGAVELAAVDTVVDSILVDTGTDGVIVATNNDKTEYELSASSIDEILDDAVIEPGNVPSWAGMTLRSAIAWLAALSRNEMHVTATTQTLRNDADNGDIATATVSDDGTTATRGEWS